MNACGCGIQQEVEQQPVNKLATWCVWCIVKLVIPVSALYCPCWVHAMWRCGTALLWISRSSKHVPVDNVCVQQVLALQSVDKLATWRVWCIDKFVNTVSTAYIVFGHVGCTVWQRCCALLYISRGNERTRFDKTCVCMLHTTGTCTTISWQHCHLVCLMRWQAWRRCTYTVAMGIPRRCHE